jgi:hypothetical protein
MQVDAEQIAEGVVVLGAIQAACRDTTGLGFDGSILTRELSLNEGNDGVGIGGGRLGNAGRRHFASFEFLESALPDFAIGCESLGRDATREAYAPRSCVLIVAGQAMCMYKAYGICRRGKSHGARNREQTGHLRLHILILSPHFIAAGANKTLPGISVI